MIATLDRPYLQLSRVAVCYHGQAAVVNVTLPVEGGKVTALVGPSGSGKSSLLTAVNRLTELTPGCTVAGNITLDGVDIATMDPVVLRRQVGFIFQKPNPFPMSIRRNLALPLKEHGASRAEIATLSEQALKNVGLWDEVNGRLDTPATALSGGQQQRLCIARALVLKPKVLLMDEPCSALDPIASAKVEQLILSLKDRYTVLMVTHNLGQARRLADRVGLLWARSGPGRLIEQGPADQLFNAPKDPLTAAYLGLESGVKHPTTPARAANPARATNPANPANPTQAVASVPPTAPADAHPSEVASPRSLVSQPTASQPDDGAEAQRQAVIQK